MKELLIANSELRSINYEDRQLDYELRRSDRKTLEIGVHPDGRVIVAAPDNAAVEKIEEKIKKRIPWINRHLQETQSLILPQPKRWVAGETHRYLGRQYRLRIDRGEAIAVHLRGAFFEITVCDRNDTNSIKDAVETWYREHAQPIFEQRLAQCLQASKPFMTIERPDLVIRKMQKRWGSCTPSGRILLNLNLIKAPLPCIDYVIMHELCHLQIMNHTPSFWRLLSKCLPDWEKQRQRLSKIDI